MSEWVYENCSFSVCSFCFHGIWGSTKAMNYPTTTWSFSYCAEKLWTV